MPEGRINQDLQDALYAGFIDGTGAVKNEYLPRLLVNTPQGNQKVLTSILSELESCDEFFFSVAFVTNSGIAVLINALAELRARGVKGHIVASQYQNFTEPRALRRLIRFDNLEVRIQSENNFHAKGYIFRHGDDYTVIVGSSNLTQNALTVNAEWNLKVYSQFNGTLTGNMLSEFSQQFTHATVVTDQWIDQYEKIYSAQSGFFTKAQNDFREKINIDFIGRPQPNKMQVEALFALENLRNEGKTKALLISATGTGKTYLSAFDARKVSPKRLLFVVHRENIALAARRTFQAVFGSSVSMGMYTGNSHDLDSDFIFSTVQTLSRENHLHKFARDAFDYIVIDEVHRAGTDGYQRLISYFKPAFLLGMSATPERTDGYDIFKTFDYNIAYEIRLHHALEQDMLVPFHYYGVTDITVDGTLIEEDAAFLDLTSDERLRHILRYIQFYGCDKGRVKGLIFCSRVDEAKKLSEEMNAVGWRTLALTGDSSEDERERAIQRLESDDTDNCLDYILTRDIFNEGVDIPSVNQIVMLRPTESVIVFVQQLGRGLRKADGKEFLTVIDFLGNYSNNFLVPIALYGDTSRNKDNIRKMVSSGSTFLPGASTVSFDPISKQRIYESINVANTSMLKDLKKDYTLLKYKIGRVPQMMDFVRYGSRDPYSYVNYSDSYYAFACKIDPENNPPISKTLFNQLAFFSKEICNGKRLLELIILQLLLSRPAVSISEVKSVLSKHGLSDECDASLASAVSVINGQFCIASAFTKYCCDIFCSYDGTTFSRTFAFDNLLQNAIFTVQLQQAVEYGIYTFDTSFSPVKYRNGFILFEKYSRKDAERILNWPKDESSTTYGYRVKYNTCPIFVTYNKSEDISESTKYEDFFISRRKFHWMTRNKVSLDSSEAQQIIAHEENHLRICLFVKQSDGESDDFYYVGDCTPYEWKQLTIKDKYQRDLAIVNFNFELSDDCDESLYKYLTATT